MTKPIASARIVGDKDVMRALGKLSDILAGKVLELALTAGGLEIMNAAKVLVAKKTRSLARSIHVGGHTEETSDPAYDPSGDLAKYGVEYSDIKGNKSTKRKAEVHIGTNVEYGPYVEFGTSKMAARPYLRPAFDENVDKARKQIIAVLRSQLKKLKTVR
ncbi:MAG: HK97-gp10 family putative phage morphogenesis protein [Dehalococcoidia bacterium]